MTPDDDGATAVEEYLAATPEPQRTTLAALRGTLRRIVPHADECMKYGMPALALHGKAIARLCVVRSSLRVLPDERIRDRACR